MSKETLEDTYRYLRGGYYGVREMDEYSLKEYVLKDIDEYIERFVIENSLTYLNTPEENEKIDKELSTKTKLQDALLVLPKVEGSMELTLLIKKKIKEIKEAEKLKN